MGDFGPFFANCIFYGYDRDPKKIWPNLYMFYPPKTSISLKVWSQNGDLVPFELQPTLLPGSKTLAVGIPVTRVSKMSGGLRKWFQGQPGSRHFPPGARRKGRLKFKWSKIAILGPDFERNACFGG